MLGEERPLGVTWVLAVRLLEVVCEASIFLSQSKKECAAALNLIANPLLRPVQFGLLAGLSNL